MILHLSLALHLLTERGPFPKSQTTYHKFVKTTPNPNATMINNGELVGPPPPPPPPLDDVGVGVGELTTCGVEVESGSTRED